METKYYYSFNAENNEYTGKFPAVKNPRRPSEYLLPYKAIFEEPPETGENETVIRQGGSWQIVPDFRGKTQINIESREVSKIDYIGKVKSGFQIITEETALDIQNNPEKYKRINDALVDISETEEYRLFLLEKEKQKRISEIKAELAELDTKRIRAVCEPSIKDENTGETRLDYYNAQAAALRIELQNL